MARHEDISLVGLAVYADERGSVHHREVDLASELLSWVLAGEGDNSIGNPLVIPRRPVRILSVFGHDETL
jgi:hypothetical protein